MNMKSKMKSVSISSLLVLSLITTACTKSGGEASAPTSTQGGSSEQGASFTYMMAGKYINWINDLKWYPVLKQETKTDVKFVNGGEDDAAYTKNLELKIGSGQFPDSGVVSLAQAEVYGKQGLFMDLKPIIDKVGPNIKAYIEKNPDYKNLITTQKGEIFGLPQEYPTLSNVTFYRADLFEKAGIKENPKTIEEFTNNLKKLKEANKGVSDFYPLTGRDGYIKFTEAFDAIDRIDANGKVHGIYETGAGTDLYSEGTKQLIEWYSQLYKDKLIDPEWVAGTATEESWQTKMLTGKGAIGNDFFTRPSWFMNNGGPTNNPSYSIKVMEPFAGKDGKQTKLAPSAPKYRMDRVFVINKKSKDKAEAIIKFMDYVFSDKGRNLMDYGVEGQSYKSNNGTNEFLVKFEEEGNKPLGTPVWNFLQDRLTFPAPVNNAAYYQWMDALTKSFATTYFDKYTSKEFPSIKYTTEQLKERTTLLAKVKEEYNANLVKFITGQRNMSEWNDFLKKMEEVGYKKVVEIDQTAYDAMKK
jgi:putative aldouronate transport system substrate-binding protein